MKLNFLLTLGGCYSASVRKNELTSEVDINEEWWNELKEGDIKGSAGKFKLFGKQGRSAVNAKFLRWPHEPRGNYVAIPFEMGPEMPIITRAIAQDAKRNYALRTCIDLKPWEGEENYIQVHQYGGCWSYIGWAYAGGQDLSIGSGCNSQSGTFQHEFMHALGIFHEQSRPDRDTYVSINLTYVSPGTEGNFAKYTFDEVSIEDVPYDYESVMHYSATGFVQPPGSTSIDPKIPYFSKVIGQRKDFSRNDVQKINHMYGCSEPLLNSFSCDFTELNWCGFVNQPVDDEELAQKLNQIEWRQYDVKAQSLVGDVTYPGKDGGEIKGRELPFPITDHSDGRPNLGRYLSVNGSYFENDNNSGRTGVLQSRQFTTKSSTQCLEMWSYTKTLSDGVPILVEVWESSDRYGEIIGDFPVHSFTISDSQGLWKMSRWNINAPQRFKLKISSTLGSDDDVVVIDDVSVLDRECESHEWMIYNFQELYDTTAHGEYIQSDIMTASTGHRFILRFYPRGHPNRENEDYASLFLHLHESSNDLDLEWPWRDQYLKFIAQDQISDVVNRMDQNRIRSTGPLYYNPEEEPKAWMPVEDADDTGASKADSVIGYETFIPTFDIFESSYSYVKNDMFSILLDVRDMSKVDLSSKLSMCSPCAGEGKSCQQVKNNPYKYECTCHYPYEEVINEEFGNFTCGCPVGYIYNPDAENQEVERLSCYSLCDFPQTNPCGDDEVCKQDLDGAHCEKIEDKPIWTTPDPKPTPTDSPTDKPATESPETDKPVPTDEPDDSTDSAEKMQIGVTAFVVLMINYFL